MPLHYVDSSALVKKYLPERGTEWVRQLVSSEPIAVSLLASVELASALSRRALDGDLTPVERDAAYASFLKDAQGFIVLAVSQPILEEASSLLLSRPSTVSLRALDALHLASAKIVFALARRRGIDTGSFITADRALYEASAWQSIRAVDPEEHA